MIMLPNGFHKPSTHSAQHIFADKTAIVCEHLCLVESWRHSFLHQIVCLSFPLQSIPPLHKLLWNLCLQPTQKRPLHVKHFHLFLPPAFSFLNCRASYSQEDTSQSFLTSNHSAAPSIQPSSHLPTSICEMRRVQRLKLNSRVGYAQRQLQVLKESIKNQLGRVHTQLS